jgi:hypothetical protein
MSSIPSSSRRVVASWNEAAARRRPRAMKQSGRAGEQEPRRASEVRRDELRLLRIREPHLDDELRQHRDERDDREDQPAREDGLSGVRGPREKERRADHADPQADGVELHREEAAREVDENPEERAPGRGCQLSRPARALDRVARTRRHRARSTVSCIAVCVTAAPRDCALTMIR